MQFKTLLFFLLLFYFPILGHSQNFYQTTIHDSLENDPDYVPIRQKIDSLNQEINQLFKETHFTIVEQVLLKDLLFFVEKGKDSLLVTELAKREIREIITINEIDQEVLVKLTRSKKPFLQQEGDLRMIYSIKERLTDDQYKNFHHPENQDEKKELAKYNLKHKEKILEIGAGDLRFSKEILKKVKNCDIYLNELDTFALKRIYYELDYLAEIKMSKEKRGNQFFLIRGGEKTTGIENIKFDRIVIRKTIHHFSHPKEMFISIKKSMHENSELIVKERFPENCKVSCCPDLLSQDKFETLMQENGFIKTYCKKLTNRRGGKYWIYKFKLSM